VNQRESTQNNRGESAGQAALVDSSALHAIVR
jgi:hypothetical protein